MNYQAGKEANAVFQAAIVKRHNDAYGNSDIELKGYKASWDELEYYAYPQTFSSTAGPHNGMGGCAMSTFTVNAYVCTTTGDAILFCAGLYQVCRKWKPFSQWR